MNEQQQSVLEVLVAFAVIIKSVYHITGELIKDGYEEKNSSRVAEPHSVRRKLASHLARLMFHTQLMENLSCDVLAWRYKVSYKLKDDGGVGSHCCEHVYSLQVVQLRWLNFCAAPTSRFPCAV